MKGWWKGKPGNPGSTSRKIIQGKEHGEARQDPGPNSGSPPCELKQLTSLSLSFLTGKLMVEMVFH